MKPKFFCFLPSRKNSRLGVLSKKLILSLAIGGVGISPVARAANFNLEANDASSSSSFTNPLTNGATSPYAAGWTDGVIVNQAPSSGNDYFTGAFVLRTPTTGDHTFGGDSLTLQSGGQLALKGASGSTITVNDLILDGGQLAESGASLTGTYNLAGAISVTANGGLIRPFGSTGSNRTILNISAAISGTSGTLTVDNGGTNNRGTTRLSAANTFSGIWTVTGSPLSATNGALQLNHFDAVKSATVNVESTHATNPGLTFSAGAGTYNIGALTGAVATGRVLANSGVILSVGDKDTSTSFAGVIAGAGALTKTGSGALTLGGTNIYTGATTINEGTLTLGATGSIAKSGTISVASGTTLNVSAVSGWTVGATDTQKLTGSGGVTGATTIGVNGSHNAGDAAVNSGVGSQAFSSSLTYGDGSIFDWDLNANSNVSGYDTVSAVGAVTAGTGTVFNVIFGAGVDLGEGFWSTPNTTKQWSMASIFGSTFSGSFASVTSTADPLTQGSFTIDGSNLTWTSFTAVPEPTSALAGLLVGAGLLRRRRA